MQATFGSPVHPIPTPRTAHDGVLSAAVANRLLDVVQALSSAHDLASVMAIVRTAARDLTGADGATFVLRDDDSCLYADENAIAPLWKGRRFPMSACISGWAMLHKEAVSIDDIYEDARVPHDAYRPTFVKSLAMVPIRATDPIGAIGTYWATRRHVTTDELAVLQALANSVSIAMANVNLLQSLEKRVEERTVQLGEANRALESFSYAVAHELRTPIGQLMGFAELLAMRDDVTGETRDMLQYVDSGARDLNRIVADLLRLAHLTRKEVVHTRVDVSALARDVGAQMRSRHPSQDVTFVVDDGLVGEGDASLLRVVFENLVGNAWKYGRKKAGLRVHVGAKTMDDRLHYFVQDDGAGFDAAAADRLFMPFARFHDDSEFAGTGVGLSTVRQIIGKHGGRITAESAPGQGATFTFTLGS
ncbi:MAG: HAMP domain-containing sensor histidine kinase [Polyangiaceae bacterium]